MKNFLKALVFILIAQSSGILGSLFTINSIGDWYSHLTKPALTPPNWLFGPAWIFLYTLIGISVYLIWEKREQQKNAMRVLLLFFVHFFFNAIWTPVFFGFQQILLGLLVILIVLITGIFVAIKFYKINKFAGYLLIPYLLWVSFATYLNFGIYILN